MIKGQCHCGAVRYEVTGEATHNSICHCTDCRRHAGAPLVSWAGYKADGLTVHGETRVYASSENVERHFCPECGTGLFYYNDSFVPGVVDIQTATFDDPDAYPPRLQVQYAEHIGWVDGIDRLPRFERFPGQDPDP